MAIGDVKELCNMDIYMYNALRPAQDRELWAAIAGAVVTPACFNRRLPQEQDCLVGQVGL